MYRLYSGEKSSFKRYIYFVWMVEYIEDYIYSRREYKNMHEANSGYALQGTSFCNVSCGMKTFRLNGKLKGQIPITHI